MTGIPIRREQLNTDIHTPTGQTIWKHGEKEATYKPRREASEEALMTL